MEHPSLPQEKVAFIFELYERYGAEEYSGESVSQLEHMCQCAQLATEQGFSEEVILAAFFHDLGHLLIQDPSRELMGKFGVKSHEKLGANLLRSLGFSENMAQLVENHVEAKRYLTARYPEYLNQLSEASKETLVYQGGPMTAEEVVRFEQDPLFDMSLKMRTWDEQAKLVDLPVTDLDHYRSMALRHLQGNLEAS